MAETSPSKVVVAGDAGANWLITGVRQDAPGNIAGAGGNRIPRWRREPGVAVHVREGGSLLLSRFLSSALGESGVASPAPADLASLSPEHLVRTYVRLELGPPSGNGRASLRIARIEGCAGPRSGITPTLPVASDPDDADVVVVHDSGNGFATDPGSWPLAVRVPPADAVFIVGLSRGLSDNQLLSHLRLTAGNRLVAVVDADDLRGDGIPISRRLSWERTAREVVWQLEHNAELRALGGVGDVVIRLGLEGAVHASRRGGTVAARLYYDPTLAEGGFSESQEATALGGAEAFVAALSARIAREGTPGIGEGTRDGIKCARRLAGAGFGTDPIRADFPGPELFAPSTADVFIADAAIPPSRSAESADPDYWCVLDRLGSQKLEPLAHRILVGDDSGLQSVPLGQFGDMRTVDRSEIESYTSIQSLIGQYLARRETKRPLCLAVFGPPGSGKSFGVEQVAKSVAMGSRARVEKIEVNMSQLDSVKSLSAALHLVRDAVVKGRVPLVFFDEFDSPFGGQLGWLRYFLAPMQDGVFRDGDAMHPVGKSIFVFAGGLSSTFAHFSRQTLDAAFTDEERAGELRRFREAKGPDFVSRLRGFVNVKGPNPDAARPDDRLYLIRRAMIARSIIERNWSSLRRRGEPGRLNIDESIVRAIIGVPEYRHGVRSIEAVLEMSMLDGATEFDPSALPAPDQLDQHVDADAFARLVLQGILFSAAREAIAEAIHNRYLEEHAKNQASDSPALRPWTELSDSLKASNRAQADDMIRKLERIDCGYRPVVDGNKRFAFTNAEVEQLAELEHERWMNEKLAAGHSFGAVRDEARKTHPDLLPWSDLSEKSRDYDRTTVAAIPDFMASAGFEVYRL